MQPKRTRIILRALELSWLIALGAALTVVALTTDRRARQVEENPTFCDPFGYLQMAQDIRLAAASGKAPQFTMDTPHTRLLVDLMKSHQLPIPVWDEMVAPLAYHYFPAADHVAVQYSPGAGLVLAPFPEGAALHGLNRLVIAIFLACGLLVLVASAFARLPLAAGFFVLALNHGLEILGQLDNASFSMNALLAPLLLSGVILAVAWAVPGEKSYGFYFRWGLTFLAGILFGFALLARTPVVFLLPGMLVLLWPGKLRAWPRSGCLAFMAGVFLGGIAPIAFHQSRVAGAWYLPTYAHENSTLPTLECFWSNVSYYFGPGKSSTENWVLAVMVLAFICLLLWSARRGTVPVRSTLLPRPGWVRFSAAVLIMLGLSNAYFLTHVARVHYYTWPALFGASLVLALGAFTVENHLPLKTQNRGRLQAGTATARFGGFTGPGSNSYCPCLEPLYAHDGRAGAARLLVTRGPGRRVGMDLGLRRKRNALVLRPQTGHKLTSTNAETREVVYKFVKDRGEPQYVVTDGQSMQAVADEIVQNGGSLERRGEVYGYPYFLIHWPAGKP